MLDARYVADHLDEVRAQLARRGPEHAQALDGLGSLVSARRELTRKTELLQAERNGASDAMAKLAKSGDKAGMYQDVETSVASSVGLIDVYKFTIFAARTAGTAPGSMRRDQRSASFPRETETPMDIQQQTAWNGCMKQVFRNCTGPREGPTLLNSTPTSTSSQEIYELK